MSEFAPASLPATSGLLEPISVRIPEAVRLTGISRSRLYDMMRNGEIEYVKVGASTLIIFAALRRFIEQRREAGRQEK